MFKLLVPEIKLQSFCEYGGVCLQTKVPSELQAGGRGLQTVHPESHKEGLCAVAVKCRTGGYGAGEPTRCSCADTMITGESVFVRVNAPGQMLLEPERKGPLKDHSCSIHVSFACLLLGSGLDLWRFNEEPVEEQQAVTHTQKHTHTCCSILKMVFQCSAVVAVAVAVAVGRQDASHSLHFDAWLHRHGSSGCRIATLVRLWCKRHVEHAEERERGPLARKNNNQDAVHSFVHFFDYVKGYIANVWFARFYH